MASNASVRGERPPSMVAMMTGQASRVDPNRANTRFDGIKRSWYPTAPSTKISVFSPGWRARRPIALLQSSWLVSGMKNSSSGSSFVGMSFALRGAPCGDEPRPPTALGRYHDQQGTDPRWSCDAFHYVYRMPPREDPVAALTFGSTAHEAFEAFTKDRRERIARGDPAPTREDLEREFRTRWVPTGFGDKATEETYQRRVATLLDNFWEGEVSSIGEAIAEELNFELVLDLADGSPPVIVSGQIDRIDRLPTGGIEVVDYKTGRAWGQKAVDESLQLSIYALACRDALDLGTPERVTLYFTESALRLSTTRSDEQLDAARADVLARVARIRAGEFAATPSADACRWCDWRAMCPVPA
ncbi:MAG: PD-(D/E)XK nuclease family protein [Chloroflexi bacterium]|nr:PD-(D/E)XK nuclease family protein [Chloroflexota bacterium]